MDKTNETIETRYDVPNKSQSSSSSRRPTKQQQHNNFIANLRRFFKTQKYTKTLLTVFLASLTLIIMSLVALAIILPLVLQKQSLTTASCVLPYVRSSSTGNCVNILIDFNNCGADGNICLSNYTSCSGGLCSTVPVIQLTSYTSIWTGAINGPSDDDTFNMTLPFDIQVYTTTSSFIQLTTNGVICLSTCSDAWLETALPSSYFGAAVLPYWDDLFIDSKTWQGIYYASQGTTPTRTLVLEYYTSRYGSPSEYYHFQVKFFEATPAVVQFIYYDAFDTGASCTVGVQGTSEMIFLQILISGKPNIPRRSLSYAPRTSTIPTIVQYKNKSKEVGHEILVEPKRSNTKSSTTTKNDDRNEILFKVNQASRFCCQCSPTCLLLIPLILMLLGGAIAATVVLLTKTPTGVTLAATTTTTSATTIVCVSSYVPTPSQACVNVIIEFHNCGTVGHVCPNTNLSCSASVCSTDPSIQLPNPHTGISGSSGASIDDIIYPDSLPFSITLCGTTTNQVTVTSTDVLCLRGCSTAFTETALPKSLFNGTTVFLLCDDLYIYADTSQGIYYQADSQASNRTLTFEYYMSHYSQPTQLYQFRVKFFETAPGIVQFKFFYDVDGDSSCTVGVQNSYSGPFMQYSYNQTNSVHPNMTLTFNTNLGAYTHTAAC
ncbi:unnamed protein product [Rotaria socialis]|uniref:Uncharacterized protein n=1 Tax=Rotaria socialis TaxID=392032 RepID=A0A820YU13_9BILA|nr:unnamed protein product [Rotaria socialis]